jgi:hypothetical protein
MVCLLITRLLCETGLPSLRIYDGVPLYFLRFFPAGVLAAATIYMSAFVEILFQYASRVSATAMATHAIALNRDAGPRRQLRLACLFPLILVLGLVIAGTSHLWCGYRFPSSLDGAVQPVNALGSRQVENTMWSVLSWGRGSWGQETHNRGGHLLFGMSAAGLLQWACLATPKWPLHPIGFLLVDRYFGIRAWWSVFFGWLLKILIVRYGGASGFRAARPLFLGLIAGSVLSAIFWIAVTFVMIALGREYVPWYPL